VDWDDIVVEDQERKNSQSWVLTFISGDNYIAYPLGLRGLNLKGGILLYSGNMIIM